MLTGCKVFYSVGSNDDTIASYAAHYKPNLEKVIISRDKDFYRYDCSFHISSGFEVDRNDNLIFNDIFKTSEMGQYIHKGGPIKVSSHILPTRSPSDGYSHAWVHFKTTKTFCRGMCIYCHAFFIICCVYKDMAIRP